jgi:hypothetical protein
VAGLQIRGLFPFYSYLCNDIMVQRVYIDTSVIGGCFDEEFITWSNLLVKELLSGQKIAIISDLTIDEIEEAPKPVQDKLDEIIRSDFKELIASDQEAQELAESDNIML